MLNHEDLEVIVKETNSKNKFKKTLAYTKTIAIGGVLPEKHQQKFAEKINWDSKKLTMLNAIILGGGTTLADYLIFGEGGSFITSKIAETIDTTYKIAVYSYLIFNSLQSVFRISYAQIKNKGIASFTLFGAFIDAIYIPYSAYKEKKNKKL